jgi:hypothetical protein
MLLKQPRVRKCPYNHCSVSFLEWDADDGPIDGMFLYAMLVMQNLFNSVNREDLYKEIHPDALLKGIEQA